MDKAGIGPAAGAPVAVVIGPGGHFLRVGIRVRQCRNYHGHYRGPAGVFAYVVRAEGLIPPLGVPLVIVDHRGAAGEYALAVLLCEFGQGGLGRLRRGLQQLGVYGVLGPLWKGHGPGLLILSGELPDIGKGAVQTQVELPLVQPGLYGPGRPGYRLHHRVRYPVVQRRGEMCAEEKLHAADAEQRQQQGGDQ